jgi:hypothetical protein
MRVVIAGGHGKIALILERLLTQLGDSVAGFIRNPDHAADLQAVAAQPLIVDLETASVDDAPNSSPKKNANAKPGSPPPTSHHRFRPTAVKPQARTPI